MSEKLKSSPQKVQKVKQKNSIKICPTKKRVKTNNEQ